MFLNRSFLFFRAAVWIALLLVVALPARAGQNWAVIIGVDNYGGNTPSLQYAEKDAARFRDLLLGTTPSNHIRFLTTAGTGDDLPTGANIVAAARQMMLHPGPADDFWFFFSGHGQDEGKAHYLIPMDYRVSNLHDCGVDLVALRALLARSCAARRKVMIVDACHSGADDPATYGGAGDASTVVLTSCRSSEESWEIPSFEEGAFAYYLLGELSTKGAKGLGMTVPTKDVAQKIQSEVQRCVSRIKHKTQTPQIFGRLPTGGLLDPDSLPDPPGDLTARDPLGPAVVVDFTEERTLADGSKKTSDYARTALSDLLVHRNFPLVDESAARELDHILDRQQAAARTRQLGARFLLRGTVRSAVGPSDPITGFLSLQVSATLELSDTQGRILYQHAFIPSSDSPQDHAGEPTEEGTASEALQTLGDMMAKAVVPKLQEILNQGAAKAAP